MTIASPSPAVQFGPNLWLVDELYQLFLDDPRAVDPSWYEFFADYRPTDTGPSSADESGAGSSGDAAGTATVVPAVPPQRRSDTCTIYTLSAATLLESRGVRHATVDRLKRLVRATAALSERQFGADLTNDALRARGIDD